MVSHSLATPGRESKTFYASRLGIIMAPAGDEFEDVGVLNPAAVRDSAGDLYLLITCNAAPTLFAGTGVHETLCRSCPRRLDYEA